MANKTAVVILNWNGKELMRRYLPAVIENSEAAGGVDVVVADRLQLASPRKPSVPKYLPMNGLLSKSGEGGGASSAQHDFHFLCTTTPPVFQMLFSGTTPRTQEVG